MTRAWSKSLSLTRNSLRMFHRSSNLFRETSSSSKTIWASTIAFASLATQSKMATTAWRPIYHSKTWDRALSIRPLVNQVSKTCFHVTTSSTPTTTWRCFTWSTTKQARSLLSLRQLWWVLRASQTLWTQWLLSNCSRREERAPNLLSHRSHRHRRRSFRSR